MTFKGSFHRESKYPLGGLPKEDPMDSQSDSPKKKKAYPQVRWHGLEKIHKRLLNIFNRDTYELLLLSGKGKLDKDSSAGLVNYLKLIKELKKIEEGEAEKLSDEELEKIANKAEKT